MTTRPSGDFPEANDDTEFSFNFAGGQLKSPPLSAAELFDGGKIKPLKLLPRSQCWGSDCPKSPRSPKRMLTKEFLTSPPRHKKIDSHLLLSKTKEEKLAGQKEPKCFSATVTVTDIVSEPTNIQQSSKEIASLSSSSFSRSSSSSSSSWSRKWKFLFRSASEGHATSKDDDYSFIRKSKKEEGVKKNLSFRSEDSVHSGSTRGGGRKKGRVSAHEWLYKKNRAAAEERRKKTFLPYKKNLLGCMDLDPGVRQVSRWIGVEIRC